MMINVDPYNLRQPPEFVLGYKGARYARLFEIIRYQNLANTAEKRNSRTAPLTSAAASEFLQTATASFGAI